MIIDRRMLEPTKKRYPVSKDKKLQQDSRRGTIMIKSNFILTGWVTHRLENNTKEVLALLWRLGTPHQASPVWGSDKGTGDPQGIWPKPSRIWSQDLHRSGGKQTPVLEGTTHSCGAVTPQETEPKLHASVGGSPVEAWVGRGSHRPGGTGSSCLGRSPVA